MTNTNRADVIATAIGTVVYATTCIIGLPFAALAVYAVGSPFFAAVMAVIN